MSETLKNPVLQRGRGRSRAFLPVVVWLSLIGLVVLWKGQRRVAEGTTVTFKVLVEGEPMFVRTTVTLDGKPFESGRKAPIGKNTLVITGPGLEPFEKRFRLWFQPFDLGDINLTRSKGTLVITTEPKSRDIKVTGERFKDSAAGSSATFGPIPVGSYRVTADFGLFKEEQNVEVRRNETARLELKPAVGTLELKTEPTPSNYRLSSAGSRGIASEGHAPARLESLPVGEYQLRVWRGNYIKRFRVDIKPGETNRTDVGFAYAEVKFDTMPSEAKVFSGTEQVGQTPLTVPELMPGEHRFRIVKEGYVPVNVALDAVAGQTHAVTTNLLSVRYEPAMRRARALGGGFAPDYQGALSSVDDALRAMPGDAEATALRAKLQAALTERESQLAARKQQVEMSALAAKQQTEAKTAERRRLAEEEARKRFPGEAFRKATTNLKDSNLFDAQMWMVQSEVSTVAEGLRRLLQRKGSGWKLDSESKINDETFLFKCSATKGILSTTERNAVVVVGQVAPAEVQIHAKFWDYMSTEVGLSLAKGLTKEGLVPVNQRFFKPEQAATVAARRKAVPEEFKTKLLNELK